VNESYALAVNFIETLRYRHRYKQLFISTCPTNVVPIWWVLSVVDWALH